MKKRVYITINTDDDEMINIWTQFIKSDGKAMRPNLFAVVHEDILDAWGIDKEWLHEVCEVEVKAL